MASYDGTPCASTPNAASNGADNKWKRPDGRTCSICGKRTSWCQVSDDGAIAMCRHQPNGSYKSKTDSNGILFYLHRLVPLPEDQAEPVAVEKANGKPHDLADVDTRHKVYNALLDALKLSAKHLDDLANRGLKPDEITERKYRTFAPRAQVKVAAILYKRFGKDVLLSVPGFWVNTKSQLSMCVLSGLIIPVRDLEHRIVALKVRPDELLDSGAKYLWVSSASHKGPSPGSLPHVPSGFDVRPKTWRLTEGELKADVATVTDGVPTISAPGASIWRPCVPILKAVGCKTVRLAFDADAWQKPEVGRALAECARTLKAEGFAVEVERWDPAKGKGIDDVLVAGFVPEVLTGEDAARAIAEAAPGPPGDHEAARTLDQRLAQFKRTDLGNAERLVARHGRDLRFCHPWSKWLVWDERRWGLDRTAAARYRARSTVRAIYSEAVALGDEEARREHAKWGCKSEDGRKITAMLFAAQAEKGVPVVPEELNTDPWLFNCRNGTVDLRTGELRPHSREDLITQLCPHDYDPSAACPLWLETLGKFFHRDDPELKAELISYWQRLCGYTMVGVVRDHIMPVAFGTGSNGKSTLFGALLDALGPDYAMKCPPDMLMAKKTDSHPTDRADLFGKRLVVSIETEAGRRLNETMIKELTGGDSIRARRMREDFWEFKPTHTLFMATNHKPVIRGTDNGIWRRLKLVPFVVKVDDRDADKAMPEKLRAEYPGILAWSVRGCLEWQRQGLEAPEEVTEATKQYRRDQDLLGAFLEECTVAGPSFRTKAGVLYGRYKTWAEAGGEFVTTQTAFGLALSERGFEKKSSNGTWYQGITLKDTRDQDDDPDAPF